MKPAPAARRYRAAGPRTIPNLENTMTNDTAREPWWGIYEYGTNGSVTNITTEVQRLRKAQRDRAAAAELRRMADEAPVTPPPALTEVGQLRARVAVLEEAVENSNSLAKLGARCFRDCHDGQLAGKRAEVEGHRFALAVKLGLDTLASWDAIYERVAELHPAAEARGNDKQDDEATPTAEQIVQDHVLTVHQIGEQLAAVESWLWEHLAYVRDTAVRAAEPAAEAGCVRCGHSQARHMGDEHERGCHACWDSPGNSGWNHRFEPDHEPDAPRREPHPTQADLDHALAVAARFHGQNTDTAAEAQQDGAQDRG